MDLTLTDAPQTPVNRSTPRPLWEPWARLLFLTVGSLALGVIVATHVGWSSPEETFQAGLEALERGDLGGVTDAIESLKRESDFDPHVRLLTGALTLRRGDPAAALDYFAAIRPVGELRAPLLLLTGECLYRQGRLAEAEPLLQQLSREDPDHVDAHRWLGAIYYDLGANDAAIGQLQRVVELAPEDYRPHRLLGLMYSDFSRNAPAIEHYRQALALNPPKEVRHEIIRELGHALIAERQYGAALESLAGAAEDADILALRGDCYWGLGDHAAAHDSLREAQETGDHSRLLDLLTAKIELEEGSPAEAATVLSGALERNPHDAECRYQLAMCWREMGDEDRCREELTRWRASKDLLERLTRLNAEAIERPGDADVRDELAVVCDQLGKTELVAVWRRAAENCRESEARRTPPPSTDVVETTTPHADDNNE